MSEALWSMALYGVVLVLVLVAVRVVRGVFGLHAATITTAIRGLFGLANGWAILAAGFVFFALLWACICGLPSYLGDSGGRLYGWGPWVMFFAAALVALLLAAPDKPTSGEPPTSGSHH